MDSLFSRMDFFTGLCVIHEKSMFSNLTHINPSSIHFTVRATVVDFFMFDQSFLKSYTKQTRLKEVLRFWIVAIYQLLALTAAR